MMTLLDICLNGQRTTLAWQLAILLGRMNMEIQEETYGLL